MVDLNYERLRLIVRFDDDCKASYPLELGAYSIGSNKSCTIRLEGSCIEGVHAILSIEPDGVRILNCTSSPLLYSTGKPVEDKEFLALGDTVALGTYRLSLTETSPPHDTATRDLSPEAHGQIEELWNQLRRGLPGYDDVLAKLAPFISPEEAKAARDSTVTSLKMLSFTLLFLTLMMAGSASLSAYSLKAASILFDLASAGFLVGSLILISRYQIHIAGRVMIPLLWILRLLHEPQSSDWYEFPYVLTTLFNLFVAVMIGALIDFGASPEPRREQLSSEPRKGSRVLRRAALILVGILTIYDAVEESKNLQGWVLVLFALSGIACMAWSWWPRPVLERAFHRDPFDIQVLKLIGIRRWARFARGRFIAVCLGVLPALLFFYSFEVKERLMWPEDAIQTPGQRPDEPTIWFWKQAGRFLVPTDLRDKDFYGFRHRDVSKDFLKEVGDLTDALGSNPYDRTAYERIKEKLDKYRLSSAEQIQLILMDMDDRNPNQQSLYYLEENELGYRGIFGSEAPSWIFSARDQLSFGWSQFVGYTEEDIESREASSGLRRLILMICGFIGLLILWRRGGDWGFALWLGLWFVGVATAGTYRYNLFFFPSRNYEAWHDALNNSGFNLVLTVFHLLDAFVLWNIFAFSTFLSCAVLWCWVCWPTKPAQWRQILKQRPMLSGMLRILVLTLKVVAVTLAMNLLFWGTRRGFMEFLPQADWQGDLASALAGLIFVAVVFGVGIRLKARNGARLTRLARVSGILFMSTQLLALLSVPELPQRLSLQVTTLRMLNYTLVCALIFVFIILVVRKNFLRLFTLRDASVVVTAFVALTLLKLAEGLIHSGIEVFSHRIVLPEVGADILSLLAFVLLVPFMHQHIERLLLHLSLARFDSLRRLRTIERKIGTALELLLDTQDPRKIGNIRRALSTCGIKEYVFLARKEKRTFVSSVNCGSPAQPDQLVISQMLLKFLSKRIRAIDLEQLPFEWSLFFLQFELERLRQERPARYLIPIRLGESLRGLLFVSNTADQRALAGERVTEGITDLALLTTQLRYQHSSSS